MESRTEQATGSSKEVQENTSKRRKQLNLTITNLAKHQCMKKICRDMWEMDTVRRIEKPTDFSEALGDGGMDGSTEPGADTVIAVQVENRKGTTKNEVDNRPVTLQVSADDIFHIKVNFEINRLRDQNENIPKSKKSDIDKSCSKWTIPHIAEYFDFDKSVRKIEMPTYFAIGAEKVSGNIHLELIQKLQVFFKSVQKH
ncbi:Hypothetical predicted protein [Mytilus galloprovincialis]|uniref:Uncharacterized protein n=1 Tax=Mytilus galloprovincialis TaxID=29158 RepID=A0A8B6EMQ4_MYTGA|nr:Hypothetical predicted protein [Mytilus galloprovincialis]